jgi:hypothetical protein
MHHLTICQLDEILALSKLIKRDWNSMSNYLGLDEHKSCPEHRELEGCYEYHELEDVVKHLSLNALDELVALCLLGAMELDQTNTLSDIMCHVQGCAPGPRPIAELFELENLFDSLSRGLTRLGTR